MDASHIVDNKRAMRLIQMHDGNNRLVVVRGDFGQDNQAVSGRAIEYGKRMRRPRFFCTRIWG
jgi:hypothetical protein